MNIRYDISLTMRLLRAVPVIGAYFAIAIVLFLFLPAQAREIPLESLAVIGFIGLWRYSWLIIHCVRAALYEHWMYPSIQFQASQIPEEKRFPKHLYYVIPTYGEKPDVTRSMLNSVITESAQVPSEVIVFVNAGNEEEDKLFRETHARHPSRDRVQLKFIRQVGGKRQGMADVLYELSQYDIDASDVVVLMDGDTVLGQGILEKSLPLFALRPNLGAVTTDNISVTKGHWLYRKWYTLRFSMRHRYMKSLSLSKQLQVLTGRFSLFRANLCVEEDFIASLENDRIKHWLHGEIQFVTGDDKSTWFTLLKKGYEMLYVPDAFIYCMEDSGPQPIRTSIKKMHRWFGNMLRNNGRAIRLGLGVQRPFVWWCHVDQRLSMWTSLLGPVCALWASIWLSWYYLIIYAILVLLVRSIYILLLTFEGHRLSLMDIPMLLYTQWVGSIVKIYTMFHLHHQKWDAHRQSDEDGEGQREPLLDFLVPKLQIAFSYAMLLLFVILLVGTK